MIFVTLTSLSVLMPSFLSTEIRFSATALPLVTRGLSNTRLQSSFPSFTNQSTNTDKEVYRHPISLLLICNLMLCKQSKLSDIYLHIPQ